MYTPLRLFNYSIKKKQRTNIISQFLLLVSSLVKHETSFQTSKTTSHMGNVFQRIVHCSQQHFSSLLLAEISSCAAVVCGSQGTLNVKISSVNCLVALYSSACSLYFIRLRSQFHCRSVAVTELVSSCSGDIQRVIWGNISRHMRQHRTLIEQRINT
jgi:hypothetical protein